MGQSPSNKTEKVGSLSIKAFKDGQGLIKYTAQVFTQGGQPKTLEADDWGKLQVILFDWMESLGVSV